MNKEKEELILNYFYKHPTKSLKEIEKDLDIPSSTIGRCLQKYYDNIIPNTNITIKEQLSINKHNGKIKGGINSFKNNDYLKDDKGKFIGSIKTTKDIDKVKNKEKDIKIICKAYLDNNLSLNELKDLLKVYTKDYIYDCINDKRTEEILGEDTYYEIKNKGKSK